MLYKLNFLLVIVGTVIGAPIEDGHVDFSEHKVVRILPNSQSFESLKNLKSEFETTIDFWNAPVPDLRPVLSLIGPKDRHFLEALNKSSIAYEIIVSNFQKLIEDQKEENNAFYATDFDYEHKYHTYTEIKNELHNIANKNPKAIYKSVGKTFEGRDIPALVITDTKGSNKQAIFLECGIHAREWISTAACLYMINKLLTDPQNENLLTKFEFIVVPTLNTDGYVYTWEVDRTWRKTRSKRTGSHCVGADPNRNWDTAWGKKGASDDPCTELYCGDTPFSEVEVKQMAELIATRRGRTAAYFAFHSYSEYWMYPWGYTHTQTPNAQHLHDLSKVGVDAIRATHGLTFTYGNIADVIYLASGSSIDWAYDKSDVKIAFALELRDKGQYGFMLPTSQIKPAVEETWAGVRAVIEKL